MKKRIQFPCRSSVYLEIFFWHLEVVVEAGCATHIPVASSFQTSSKDSTTIQIVYKIRATSLFLGNVVPTTYCNGSSEGGINSSTQAEAADNDDVSTSRDLEFMRILICPLWVLTIVHCFIPTSRNNALHGTGVHSLEGRERLVSRVIAVRKDERKIILNVEQYTDVRIGILLVLKPISTLPLHAN